jgi:hypothetical protein
MTFVNSCRNKEFKKKQEAQGTGRTIKERIYVINTSRDWKL